jgi:uncharacterized damage-inducible protein DinB
MDAATMFLAQSREYFTGHYLPKILAAVAQLSDEDLWWRPNEASNSAGNLLLHLAGNIEQWIVGGVGNTPMARDREAEFSRRAPMSRAALLERFEGVVRAADAVLSRVDPTTLAAPRNIQGRSTTVLAAVYHVVEHFAMHAGQVLYIAKLRTGRDLSFYILQDGIPRAAWPGHPAAGSA